MTDDEGSGKNTLKEKIRYKLPKCIFDIYADGISSSYDAAILVINLEDGPMNVTKDHLAYAQKTGIKKMFCFLNKSDLLPDKELQELIQLECQDLAESYGYSRGNFFIAAGSAITNENVDVFIQEIGQSLNLPYTAQKQREKSFWKRLFG